MFHKFSSEGHMKIYLQVGNYWSMRYQISNLIKEVTKPTACILYHSNIWTKLKELILTWYVCKSVLFSNFYWRWKLIDPSVESIESTQQIRFTTTDTIYIKMIVFRTLFVGGETENRDCQWWNWTSYCSWSLPVCDQWWWLASCPPQHCWQASCPPPWWCLCLCLTLQHHQNRLMNNRKQWKSFDF